MKRTTTIYRNLYKGLAALMVCLLGMSQSYAQLTATISCTGTAGSFNSGSVSSAGVKNDGNMTTINSSANRGWGKFDLSSLPPTATIISANVVFTTFSTTLSTASNNIFGFTGDPAVIAGTALYDSCTLAPSFSSSGWDANTTMSRALNSSGISFLAAHLGGSVNLGFVRGSTNTYNIYGYAGSSLEQPKLEITYSINAAMTYDSSMAVEQISTPVIQRAMDAAILRFNVHTTGALTPLSLSDITVSTAGTTTSLSDITGLKVYYTGSNPSFSTSTQLGSTITSVSASQAVAGTQALIEGNNYFWVAYDLSMTAVAATLVDAEVTGVTVGGNPYAPVVTALPGARPVEAPMTYISSFATQTNSDQIYPGSYDQEIIGIGVVMSPTGLAVNMDSLIFSTTGTTNPADIADARVWYSGSSNSFSTANLYGSLGSVPGATFTISGTLDLANDTNYFWLTYDIDAAATTFNTIDAEALTAGVNGATFTPSITAPAGSRSIDYCISIADFTGDEEIVNVSFGSMSNASDCSTTGSTGSEINRYSNYTTTVTAPDLLRCSSVPFAVTTSTCGDYYGEVVAAYVDWNQDGDFDDAEEEIFTTPYGPGSDDLVRGTSVTIPSTATLGLCRMRVVYNEDVIAPACGEYGYGETEDYVVNVVDNPPTFVYSNTQQITGSASPGYSDAAVLRIPVLANACDTIMATAFHFNTASTTSAADIATAKLYVTGNSAVFNTSKLVGTVSAPSGTFIFTVLDTLVRNDTTNYWLAYDLSGSATLGNVVDARLDSLEAVGGFHIPTNTDPAGNILVQAPMTYLSSTTTQSAINPVVEGSTNNHIIGVTISTSVSGSPINLTQLDFNANGTTDTASIHNIKVWYTGNSSTYANTNQFGSTLAKLPGVSMLDFSVTGTQALVNGDNHFWLSYDITNPAALDSVIDAECVSMIVDGSPQTPSVTAPAGTRKIRQDYCLPEYSDGTFSCLFFDSYINSVITTGGTTNISNVNTGCLGTASNYQYYAGQTLTISQTGSFDLTLEDNGFDEQGYTVWIDYNQDGVFSVSEQILATAGVSFVTETITVPCDAIPGLTRMRVRSAYFATPTLPCDDYFDGEGEDYDVVIIATPASFNATSAIQQTASAGISAMDAPVLRIPIVTSGCSVGTTSNFHFNTIGTTTLSDIAVAKLYVTGNSPLFNTSKLLGTVASPSGAFSFAVTDTVINDDTTNYWLVYDISGTATLGNVVDARFDSVEVLGSYETPIAGNPSGSVLIDVPMTYISSTVTQAYTTKVGQGSVNNPIVRYEVITSSIGSSINLTSIDINTTGTNQLSDITNLKVWYTGASELFSTGIQFGSTVASPAAFQSVIGTQPLINDTNYFWVTYNIAPAAVIGNQVDAEVASATIGGSGQTPTVSAPAGTRQIRAEYCVPSYITGTTDGDYISKVSLGSINNITGPSISPYYTNYPALSTNLNRGGYYNITLRAGSYTDNDIAAWIDFDDNGTFDLNEKLGEAEGLGSTPDEAVFTFAVPLNTPLGILRLRVVEAYDGAPGMDACGAYDYGETEDYTVTILPVPAQNTYVWNQTGADDFNDATNWTPNRTAPNMIDILAFTGGGVITATNIGEHAVSQVIVDNNTDVTLSTFDIANLTAMDSLTLTSGKITTDVDVNLTLGTDSINTGVLSGGGTIEGMFTRWIASATGSYSFPMVSGTDSRAASINYTVAPAAAGKLTVEYVTGAPGTAGLPVVDGGLNLENISDAGIWRATNDGILAAGTYDVTVNADNIGGVNDFTMTALLGRANGFSSWVAPGSIVSTTGSNAAMVLSRTGLTFYGEIGIAGTAINPLPVTFTSLAATPKSGNVILSWITASEINNKGFEVERSVDGRAFEYTGFVKGAGNSNRSLSYSFADAKAFAKAHSNILYYRLKQVDADGRYTYSNVVNASDNTQKATVSVYPNPFNTAYSISVDAAKAGSVGLKMVDIQGRLVAERSINVNKGSNEITMDNLQGLQAGIYFVKVALDGETQVLKLVKH
jgi:hypothetical protein